MSEHFTPAEELFFAGNQRMTEGDDQSAEEFFRLALAWQPDLAEAMSNLGLLKERAGAWPEAESYYRQAIDLQPDNAQIHLNLGVLLLKFKRFDDAENANRKALHLAPDDPQVWNNLGVLLACMKREVEAVQCYRMALNIDDSYARASFNLSYILLRQGHFKEGWRRYDARELAVNLDAYIGCPRWRGEDLSGKTLLLGVEAGHGDMIQFCRYISQLKRMGAQRVDVLCHPGLVALFGRLSEVDQVLSCDTSDLPNSQWDFWTPPMSIPLYCDTDIDTIPADIPYLTADPLRIAKWTSLLPTSGMRVGLAWKGNPLFENDQDRSLASLEMLAPLAAVIGVQFISLQKGPAEDEINSLSPGFVVTALGHDLQDFADTAAVIACLDLVISVDTAVAHLAGSMGKPCWLMLPDYRCDWRWLTERTDTPWYPEHTRLFRQPSDESWQPVIAELVEALAQLAGKKQ